MKPYTDNNQVGPRESELVVLPDGRKVALDRSVGLVLCAVARSGGRTYVLCNRRGSETSEEKGRWNLPSGYINWNEDGLHGAVRECREECGVDIPVEYVREVEHSTDPAENRQNIIFRYLAVLPEEFLTKEIAADGTESTDVRWIDCAELDLHPFAWAQRETIKRIVANHVGKEE